MPIKGTLLYPFRWWYRADIDCTEPIQGDQIISNPFVTWVPPLRKPASQIAVAPVATRLSASKK
jgi:hypothetical protein